MSDFIESKFRIDYRDFETLPTQLVKNLEFVNSRIRQMEHIKKLKQEIDDLELSLSAESKMIADDILRQNIFPRFGGYSDFLGQEFVSQEVIDNSPTFGNLASAIEMTAGNFRDENKIHTMFEFQLENFIWIFFEGCGTWMADDMKHVVIDYDHRTYRHGSDAYPSEYSYYFNTTNSKNGKSYQIVFTFCDLKRAIDTQYAKSNFSDIFPTGAGYIKPYESIRTAGYGQMCCEISRINKSKRDGVPAEPSKKIYFKSFDPLELAAFVKHVVFEDKGEINE